MNITELEAKMLTNLAENEYADEVGDPVWNDCLGGGPYDIPEAQRGGVVAHLSMKGLATVDTDTVTLTEAGVEAYGEWMADKGATGEVLMSPEEVKALAFRDAQMRAEIREATDMDVELSYNEKATCPEVPEDLTPPEGCKVASTESSVGYTLPEPTADPTHEAVAQVIVNTLHRPHIVQEMPHGHIMRFEVGNHEYWYYQEGLCYCIPIPDDVLEEYDWADEDALKQVATHGGVTVGSLRASSAHPELVWRAALIDDLATYHGPVHFVQCPVPITEETHHG